VLEARQPPPSLPAGATVAIAGDVPPPRMRGGLGQVRERLNTVLTESVPTDGHGGGNGYGGGYGGGYGHGGGNGHGHGHGNGHVEPTAIPSGGDRASDAADGPGDEGPGRQPRS
jgi:hypothetical protein